MTRGTAAPSVLGSWMWAEVAAQRSIGVAAGPPAHMRTSTLVVRQGVHASTHQPPEWQDTTTYMYYTSMTNNTYKCP